MRMLRMRFAAACLLGALTVGARAQAAPAPEVMDVLQQVKQNFVRYLYTVPNLFAEEHLTADHASAMLASARIDGVNRMNSAGAREADSVFTLLRGAESDPNKAPVLTETREIKVLDHRPAAAGATLDSPTMLSGAFSYAAAFLLPESVACYDYKLKTNQQFEGRPALVVEYEHRETRGKLIPRNACEIEEELSGRAFMDPQTMHILRLEQSRPKHPVGWRSDAGSSAKEDMTADWEWAIDYAPVELDGKTFWLPKAVSSTMTATPGPGQGTPNTWTFLASYKNYHLLAAHSRILPGYTVQ